MTSLRLILLPILLSLSVLGAVDPALAAAKETFPQPAELQRDVDFWLDVFTKYGSDEGVLHDNRNLAIVYERIAMPERLSRRERQRRADKRRKALQATLRSLASGKRDNLSDEEARVLALWPADVSNKSLAAAVRRIRFQQGLKERFRGGLQRAGRYRSFVNDEFTALGIPIEIAALPHVESSYNLEARSHVGASGIWQFTRSTGRRFMRVDHVVDERNDPFTATRAAGKLLAYNYSLTGNWPMAITAYNHGLGGVRRAMRKYGDEAYVDILRKYNGRTFGFASRNFYVAFLAAKEVDQNVEKYFPGLTVERSPAYSVVSLPTNVSVVGLTTALGVSSRELRKYNPALQATVWQGSKYLPKGYDLRLPTDRVQQSLADAVAALPANVVFDKQLPDMFHTVSRGDTLSQIAKSYATRVSTLVALNNLKSSHRIRAGQRLRLPAAGPAPVPASPVEPAVVVAAVAQSSEEPPQVVAQDVETPEIETVVIETPAIETVAIEAPEIETQDAEVQEVTPGVMADNLATPAQGPAQTALLSDPSDYSVASNGTIEVHPLETLGHFGDWLEIKTQRLRNLNGLAFRTPVAVGQRIKLDLDTVNAKTFEERRIAYHRTQQDIFFRQHVISGVTEHTVRSGDSIWIIALRQYKVPIWLFRQYNPAIDLHKVRPGTTLQIPLLSDVESS